MRLVSQPEREDVPVPVPITVPTPITTGRVSLLHINSQEHGTHPTPQVWIIYTRFIHMYLDRSKISVRTHIVIGATPPLWQCVWLAALKRGLNCMCLTYQPTTCPSASLNEISYWNYRLCPWITSLPKHLVPYRLSTEKNHTKHNLKVYSVTYQSTSGPR